MRHRFFAARSDPTAITGMVRSNRCQRHGPILTAITGMVRSNRNHRCVFPQVWSGDIFLGLSEMVVSGLAIGRSHERKLELNHRGSPGVSENLDFFGCSAARFWAFGSHGCLSCSRLHFPTPGHRKKRGAWWLRSPWTRTEILQLR